MILYILVLNIMQVSRNRRSYLEVLYNRKFMYTKILKFKNAIPLLEVAGSELLPYMAPTSNLRKVQALIQQFQLC